MVKTVREAIESVQDRYSAPAKGKARRCAYHVDLRALENWRKPYYIDAEVL